MQQIKTNSVYVESNKVAGVYELSEPVSGILNFKTKTTDVSVLSDEIAGSTLAVDDFYNSNHVIAKTKKYLSDKVKANSTIVSNDSLGSIDGVKTLGYEDIESGYMGYETISEKAESYGDPVSCFIRKGDEGIAKAMALSDNNSSKGNLAFAKTIDYNLDVLSKSKGVKLLNDNDSFADCSVIKPKEFINNANMSADQTKSNKKICTNQINISTEILREVVSAKTPELTNLLLFKDSSKQIKTFDVTKKTWVSINSKTSSQNKFLSKGIEDPTNLVQNTSKSFKTKKKTLENKVFSAKIEFKAFKTITSIKPISL